MPGSRQRNLQIGFLLLALAAAAGCSSPKPQPKKAPPVSLRRLWASPALPGWHCPAGGAFSLDGSRVALGMDMGEEGKPNWQIWVVGEKSNECLAKDYVYSPPDWSPVGQDVAYLVDSAGVAKLTILDARAGVSRTFDLPAGDYEHCPRWSPDGKTIALPRSSGSGPGVLLLVNASDGRVRRLPAHGSLPAFANISGVADSPAWSEDGQRVLLLSHDHFGAHLYEKALWTVDTADGSADRVYSMDRPDSVHVKAVGFDAATGDPCYLTTRFSISNRQVYPALVRYDSRSGEAVEIGQLSASPGMEIEPPRLSPDGKGMAAVSYDPNAGIAVSNALLWFRDGDSGQESLPLGTDCFVAAWSHDGRRIAVLETDDKETKIAVYEFSR